MAFEKFGKGFKKVEVTLDQDGNPIAPANKKLGKREVAGIGALVLTSVALGFGGAKLLGGSKKTEVKVDPEDAFVPDVFDYTETETPAANETDSPIETGEF